MNRRVGLSSIINSSSRNWLLSLERHYIGDEDAQITKADDSNVY